MKLLNRESKENDDLDLTLWVHDIQGVIEDFNNKALLIYTLIPKFIEIFLVFIFYFSYKKVLYPYILQQKQFCPWMIFFSIVPACQVVDLVKISFKKLHGLTAR